MPKVLNKRTHYVPKDAVYVGRPSKWGNPFVLGSDGNREEVIRLYKNYLFENPELIAQAQEELKGKDLVCWCSPAACHADVLLTIANLHG